MEVVLRCSVKKVFLKISQNLQENTCARVSFLIKLQAPACTFIKKETLTQVFSREFCESFKNTFLWNTSGGSFFINYQVFLAWDFLLCKNLQFTPVLLLWKTWTLTRKSLCQWLVLKKKEFKWLAKLF